MLENDLHNKIHYHISSLKALMNQAVKEANDAVEKIPDPEQKAFFKKKFAEAMVNKLDVSSFLNDIKEQKWQKP